MAITIPNVRAGRKISCGDRIPGDSQMYSKVCVIGSEINETSSKLKEVCAVLEIASNAVM